MKRNTLPTAVGDACNICCFRMAVSMQQVADFDVILLSHGIYVTQDPQKYVPMTELESPGNDAKS